MKRLAYLLFVIYALALALGIALFDGTGDAGDSVTHYLFARLAPKHAFLYFDHWAKPVFVLLASPFAQFGFTGVKVFNAMVTLATVAITYQTALRLQLKNAVLCIVFMLFSPLYFILTLSSLTEPLFALFLAAGIYFCVRRSYVAACIILSFMPYVRSEGLIMQGVFVLYFLYHRQWRPLPWLLTGSVIYGIAGYFVYHDVFWVYTKIPYATMSSVYGHGPLLHFTEQLINVTGVPIYVLFWIGLVATLTDFFRKRKAAEEGILIAAGFLCFFMAHSLFWYLGIFNSMGLIRVLIGVMPLIAILSLNGFNVVTAWLKGKARAALMILLIAYCVAFPFTSNPAAIHWKKDLCLREEQKLAAVMVDAIKASAPVTYPLVYSNNYLGMLFGNDHFDLAQHLSLKKEHIRQLDHGGIVIWDNVFGESESGLSKADLDADTTLLPVWSGQSDDFGQQAAFAAYQKK